jgi:hypothetical protein
VVARHCSPILGAADSFTSPFAAAESHRTGGIPGSLVIALYVGLVASVKRSWMGFLFLGEEGFG